MPSGQYKVNYPDEMKIFQTTFAKFWLVILLILLLLAPFVLDQYTTYILNISGIMVIGALGLNILTGYTGQISLGHAAFMAIGAYTTGILSSRYGISFLILLPLSGIVSTLFGLVVGIPSLRLKGLYLAIATMAFGFIIDYVLVHWNALTKGTVGIQVQTARIAGFSFNSDQKFYFLIVILVIVAALATKNLFRTKVGRAFQAIRDRDIAAEIMGINLAKYKLYSFGISSFYAGVAGCLYAYYISFIAPEHFTILISIQYITMIIVGGMGTVLGSILGAIFMTILPEVLRLLSDILGKSYPVVVARFVDVKSIIYGLIIILFLMYEPDGLSGRWRTIKDYWKSWPYTY